MTTQTKTTWRKVKLSEIVTEKGSVSGPFGSNIHSKFYTQAGVPIIRGNNLTIGINGGRYVDDDYMYLSESKAEELSQSEALPDDIIVTARGTIGQTGIIPENSKYRKYILSANQLRFRINKKIASPLFVYYWLSSKPMVRTMQNISVNVGVPNFNLKNARELLIPLASLEEQGRIADILSAFDDKIELNNKISQTLEEIAQAIFKEWFVKFRFPGHEKTEFVDSELGQIPKGWKAEKLGKVIELAYGKALKEEDRRAGNIPVVGSSGIVGFNNKALVSGPGIVVGRKGNAGSILWLDEDFFPIDTTFYVKTDLGMNYCYFALKQQKFITGDSAVPGLGREQANYNLILVPDSSTIGSFKKIVEPIFMKKASIKNENGKLISLRDLLLPRLMSGKIKI